MYSVSASELLIPEINVYNVDFGNCNIENLDEVCKKIQTPDGIELKNNFQKQ